MPGPLAKLKLRRVRDTRLGSVPVSASCPTMAACAAALMPQPTACADVSLSSRAANSCRSATATRSAAPAIMFAAVVLVSVPPADKPKILVSLCGAVEV